MYTFSNIILATYTCTYKHRVKDATRGLMGLYHSPISTANDFCHISKKYSDTTHSNKRNNQNPKSKRQEQLHEIIEHKL